MTANTKQGIVALGILSLLAIGCSEQPKPTNVQDEAQRASAENDTKNEPSLHLYTGDWAGVLPRFGLTLVLHIAGEDIDSAVISLDSPDQNTYGMGATLQSLDEQGINIDIEIVGARLALARKGENLVGVFSQGIEVDVVLSPISQSQLKELSSKPARPQTDDLKRDYIIETVSFSGGDEGVVLAGELTLPRDEPPRALLILISGSGPQDRDESLMGLKPFLVLSDYLTRNGYGVLRYDDRGTAESTGNFMRATTLDFANDTAAAAKFLQVRPNLSNIPIGYIGHSEGGLIAPLAAKKIRPDMMVILAGPSQTLSEVIIRQSRDIAEKSGEDEAQVDSDEQKQRALFDVVRGADVGEVNAIVEAYLLETGEGEARAKAMAASIGTPWLKWALDYNPAPDLRSYNGPVLGLYGQLDLQVAPAANVPGLRAALVHPKSEVKVIEGLNHLFQPATIGLPDEYIQIETTFDEAAMALIVDWLDGL